MKKNKKVVLAVSGGVDSAVAAFLLKKAGFDVTGIHYKFWKWERKQNSNQIINNSILDDISKKVGFNIITIEYEKAFKNKVVDPFINDLVQGYTPNPCVRCNPLVKYKLLNDYAVENKIPYIATGHYARVMQDNEGNYKLLKGKDSKKDQSYVLCYLNQEILSKLVLPIGNTYKSDNIEIGKKLDLKTIEFGESQDLCFVKPDHYRQFIGEGASGKVKSGDIVDLGGVKLGKHDGLIYYTIGQRKGIRVFAKEPYYVLTKNYETNQLVIGFKDDLGKDRMTVKNVNWIQGEPTLPVKCNVKIRYRATEVPCVVAKGSEDDYRVEISTSLRDITPGQYAVFYAGDELLGGGMIAGIE